MLDKIQFLLSLQILGFCVFGGITLLLRARENRAKQILGWSMLLWAFLAAVRVSVNLYLEDSKEIFHPDVLIMRSEEHTSELPVTLESRMPSSA